jgi:hypothetical protein
METVLINFCEQQSQLYWFKEEVYKKWPTCGALYPNIIDGINVEYMCH